MTMGMTDREIAANIAMMLDYDNGIELFRNSATTITKDGKLSLVAKEQVTQYYLRQNGAVLVELPKLSDNKKTALAQIALAVGRRLERFERGAKANARRTTETRRKVAQNAIQTRWSAK